MTRLRVTVLATAAALTPCTQKGGDPMKQYGPDPVLPDPKQYLLPPMSVPKEIGWKQGEKPTVPAGMKIEAIATVVLVLLTPIIILMAFASYELAATTAVFAALSSGSATAIQLWFRVPMRRAMFRRRQVASRVSTISEALSSIFWAGTAVLVAGDQYLIALLPGILAVVTLTVAWWLSPKAKRA